jgi:hypothetical protein
LPKYFGVVFWHFKCYLSLVKTPQFTLSLEDSGIVLKFANARLAGTFSRMEFCSRLLHSLSPDENRIWREAKRLDAEITGWPRNISWERTNDLEFAGSLKEQNGFSIKQYTQVLEAAMLGVTEGEPSPTGSLLFRFSISNGNEIREYRFHGKARTIAALCVLYDMERHPRNHLEINIPKKLAMKLWPVETSDEHQRTYGDPSKTADELRNEGWPRIGAATSMLVFRERVGGQFQQMYQITKQEQTLDSQMLRSNISKKWKDELFKSQDYTCQICLLKYDPELLEPDHRVPVVYEADQLTDENYKMKLMTLCRYCNQQKRETTKRLPADYDWKNSSWAYPEKFELDGIKRMISMRMKRMGKSYEEVLEELNK